MRVSPISGTGTVYNPYSTRTTTENTGTSPVDKAVEEAEKNPPPKQFVAEPEEMKKAVADAEKAEKEGGRPPKPGGLLDITA